MGDLFNDLEDELFSPLPDILSASPLSLSAAGFKYEQDASKTSKRRRTNLSSSSTNSSSTPLSLSSAYMSTSSSPSPSSSSAPSSSTSTTTSTAEAAATAAALLSSSSASLHALLLHPHQQFMQQQQQHMPHHQQQQHDKEVFGWRRYSATSEAMYNICGQDKIFVAWEDYDMDVNMESTHIFADENSHPSPCLVLYRQNQFRVTCTIKLSQELEWTTPCILVGATRVPVQLNANIYAIVEPSTCDAALGGTYEQVKIHYVSRARTKKKEKTSVSVTSFSNGKVDFTNLQFERSNIAKGQAAVDTYFRLVVDVLGKSQEGTLYKILSKMSPRLVVRSHNPGSYASAHATSSTTNSPQHHQQHTYSPPHTQQQQQQYPSPHSQYTPSPPHHTHSSSPTPSPQSASLSPPPPHEYYTHPHVPTHLPTYPITLPSLASMQQQSSLTEPVTVLMGKLGINTSNPQESLTVNGNVLVTGDIYKPSDARIKSDFVRVEGTDQLDNIRRLQIYDYLLRHRGQWERGVVAQELQNVLPNAVHCAGDVVLDDGRLVPSMLMVNERMLLFETLGATKQLDKELIEAKQSTALVCTRIDMLEENTRNDSTYIKTRLDVLLDTFTSDENPKEDTTINGNGGGGVRGGVGGGGAGDAQNKGYYVVSDGVRIFNVGPARSLFVLGFFLPALWSLGMLFVFSDVKSRRIGGILNVIIFIMYNVWFYKFTDSDADDAVAASTAFFITGFTLVCICGLIDKYKRSKFSLPQRWRNLPFGFSSFLPFADLATSASTPGSGFGSDASTATSAPASPVMSTLPGDAVITTPRTLSLD